MLINVINKKTLRNSFDSNIEFPNKIGKIIDFFTQIWATQTIKMCNVPRKG